MVAGFESSLLEPRFVMPEKSSAIFFGLLFSSFIAASEIPLRINSGGPAVGEWRAGKDFVKGGKNFSFGGGHDVSEIENPGPAKIYETVRHQNHRYEIVKVLLFFN